MGVKLLFEQGSETVVNKHKSDMYKDAQINFLSHRSEIPVPIFTTDKKARIMVQSEEPVLVTIDNVDIAKALRRNFDMLWDQDVTTYKGKEGIRTVWEEMLRELTEDETYYVLGASFFGSKNEVDPFFKDFHARRIAAKVNAKFLFLPGTEEAVKNNRDSYNTRGEIKFLPDDVNENLQINLYGDTVLLVVHRDEPIVFKIKDARVFQTFKSYFDVLWNQEVKTYKGLDAVQRVFDGMLDAGHCDFIGARGYFLDARPEWYQGWLKRANESGFTMRNVVDEEVRGHAITKPAFAEMKFTLQKEFVDLSVYWIYGDKVIMTNWDGDEPILIEMKIPRIVEVYKKQFEMLWAVK